MPSPRIHRTDTPVLAETADSVQVSNLDGDLVWLAKAEIDIDADGVITLAQEPAVEKGLL